MWFIDFLEMYQDYPEGGLPVVGKKLFWSIDLETGEESQPNPSRLAFEGSYCVFHTNPATDSTRKLPPIPGQSCHP
jgi:hypothetical protein